MKVLFDGGRRWMLASFESSSRCVRRIKKEGAKARK